MTTKRKTAAARWLGWTLALCALAEGCGGHKSGKNDGPTTDDPSALTDEQTPASEPAGHFGASEAQDGDPGEPLVLDPALRSQDLPADYRGFYMVNDIIEQRLMVDDGQFFLGTYLDSYGRDFLYGLPELLGFDAGTGLHAEFRNGKANAVNIVLWHLAMSSVARDIALQCAGNLPAVTTFSLKPEFIAVLQPLCAWPAADARKTGPLVMLWQSVMSYDAPRSEFEAFKEFFQGPDWDAATGEEAVAAMMTAMLMNPRFLVRQ
jgi:hypothetical protein